MMEFRKCWDLTTIPAAALKDECKRRKVQAGPQTPGRPKLLRPCAGCGMMLGAKDMRKHGPVCTVWRRGQARKAATAETAQAETQKSAHEEIRQEVRQEIRQAGGRRLPVSAGSVLVLR